MTSAPVNGVGSLLNFVGNKTAQTMSMGAAANSFGDVMSKASGNQTSYAMGRMSSSKEAQSSKVNSSYTGKKIPKADTGKEKIRTGRTEENSEEAIRKAGEKLVKEVADKLGVSEEEVVDAMEELGFGMEALLDADNLTQLVLTLSGEDNSLALLTNGELYGTLQELLQSLGTIKTELAEELGLTQEELQQLVENSTVAEQMPDEASQLKKQSVSLLNQEVSEEETQAKVTVTVEQTNETVKFTTDENGNVEQVEGIASREETDAETKNKGKQDAEQGNQKDGLGTGNPLIDNLVQNRAQTAEVTFEQTSLYMTPETNEIMDQILDYMKIQLKPGMDQLEMQLHPENLGRLQIQLTSKGGELTAQFQVQNEAVKTAIESQIVALRDSLREQGIKVEAVEVTVESNAFESNLWQGQGREENASYQNSRKSPRRINLNDLVEDFEETAAEEELLAAKMMEANGNTVDYTA